MAKITTAQQKCMTKCIMYQLARLALILVEGKQKTELDINVSLWLGGGSCKDASFAL